MFIPKIGQAQEGWGAESQTGHKAKKFPGEHTQAPEEEAEAKTDTGRPPREERGALEGKQRRHLLTHLLSIIFTY